MKTLHLICLILVKYVLAYPVPKMNGSKIAEQIEKNPNFVVTLDGCPWCDKAVALLNDKRYRISFDTLNQKEHGELASEIFRLYNHRTFPKIFLRGKFIGGFDDLTEYVLTEEFKEKFEME